MAQPLRKQRFRPPLKKNVIRRGRSAAVQKPGSIDQKGSGLSCTRRCTIRGKSVNKRSQNELKPQGSTQVRTAFCSIRASFFFARPQGKRTPAPRSGVLENLGCFLDGLRQPNTTRGRKPSVGPERETVPNKFGRNTRGFETVFKPVVSSPGESRREDLQRRVAAL